MLSSHDPQDQGPLRLSPEKLVSLRQLLTAQVSSVGRKFGVQPADVDDIVSETMSRLIRRPDLAPKLLESTGYLRTAAKNAVHDHLRRRRAEALSEAQLEEVPEPPQREDEAAQQVSLGEITQAIARLPHEQAQAITMHIEGLSVREISEQLGIPATTVFRLLARAREQLRASFGPEETGREAPG